jgi:hypothetical protein
MSYNVLPAVSCSDGATGAAFSAEKAEPCLLRFILGTHSGSQLTAKNCRTVPELLCACSGKVKQQSHKARSNGSLQVSQMQVTMGISLSFACRNHQPCCHCPAACLSTSQLMCHHLTLFTLFTPWPGPNWLQGG